MNSSMLCKIYRICENRIVTKDQNDKIAILTDKFWGVIIKSSKILYGVTYDDWSLHNQKHERLKFHNILMLQMIRR